MRSRPTNTPAAPYLHHLRHGGGDGIDRVVRALTSLSPKVVVPDCVDALLLHDTTAVAQAVVRQRVVLRGLRFIESCRPEFAARLRAEPIMAWRLSIVGTVASMHDHAVDALDTIARKLDIPVWLTKGSASRHWYEDPGMRDMGDVDIMVDNATDAYRLAEALLTDGYGYEDNELPWLKKTHDGALVGEINLTDAAPRSRPNIDIHFGGYAVRHCALLPPPPRAEQPGTQLCEPALNLAYLVANAAVDHNITAKDLNDLYLALTSDTLDWARFLSHLRDAGIEGFLGHLLDALDASHVLSDAERSRVDRLRLDCGTEPIAPSTELHWRRHWRRRWACTVMHAYRYGRRTSRLHGAQLAASAARFHRLALRPRLAVLPRTGRRLPRLNPWTCMRLVPAELAVGLVGHDRATSTATIAASAIATRPLEPSVLTVASTPHGELVVSARTAFIPTLYCRLPRTLVASLCAPPAAGRDSQIVRGRQSGKLERLLRLARIHRGSRSARRAAGRVD